MFNERYVMPTVAVVPTFVLPIVLAGLVVYVCFCYPAAGAHQWRGFYPVTETDSRVYMLWAVVWLHAFSQAYI